MIDPTNDLNIKRVTAVPDDYVFIIEKSTTLVPVSAKDYVFEGVCARFGVMNGNNRLYEKNDYLPHLKYLNEKINQSRLIGELDHPANFDISLKNISHIIEKLWYDEQDNSVKIRVRLLTTPHGMIARTLSDAGVPIAISSRSAGQILEGHKVRLHRIFTFDLVAEPGFTDAILQPTIAESLKHEYSAIMESFGNTKAHSILNGLHLITENYNFDDSVKIYKINDSDKQQLLSLLSEDVKQNNFDPMEGITKQEFDSYTKLVTEELGGLKTAFAQITQAITDLKPKIFEQNQQQAQTQVQQPDQNQQAIQQPQAQETTELPNITEEDSNEEKFAKLIQYVDFLALQLQTTMNHSNYVGEMINRSIGYSETLGGVLNKHVNHTNFMAKKMNEAIGYLQIVGQKTNEGINYANLLGDKLNDVINYADVIGQKTNESINYANFLGDVSETQIRHANYMSNILENKLSAMATVPSTEDRNLEVNVANLSEGLKNSYENINAEVKNIIAKINDNSQDAVLEARYPFLKLLDESQKTHFYGMDMQTKHDVIVALESGAYTNGEEVMRIMNLVVETKNAAIPNYIRFMPETYKQVYEGMSEMEKTNLETLANSGTYRVFTPYQVKAFWDTMDLTGVKERLIAEKQAQEYSAQQSINESQSKEGLISLKHVTEMSRGYSDDYVARLMRHGS